MLHQHTTACHAPVSILGIDVGKAALAVYVPATAKSLTVSNTPAGIKAFLKQYQGAALALEATGGYETALVAAALAAGHTVYRVNARRVRAFMESAGTLAKTDAIDARAIADYAAHYAERLVPFTPPSDAMRRLRKLVCRRDELIAMRTKEKNRLQAPDLDDLQKHSIQGVLACLNQQVKTIDASIRQLLEDDQVMADKIDTMTQVSGIGETTAFALLASMPELGTLTGKQITSLAGLAPHPRDSGTKKGYRRTGRGRKQVRRLLYMGALAAIRYNQDIHTFYQRLINNGKKPLQAIIAVCRKLLVILNARLRDRQLQSC
jgi:transposase